MDREATKSAFCHSFFEPLFVQPYLEFPMKDDFSYRLGDCDQQNGASVLLHGKLKTSGTCFMGEAYSILNVDPNVCIKVFKVARIRMTSFFIHHDMVKQGALTEYSKTLIT